MGHWRGQGRWGFGHWRGQGRWVTGGVTGGVKVGGSLEGSR